MLLRQLVNIIEVYTCRILYSVMTAKNSMNLVQVNRQCSDVNHASLQQFFFESLNISELSLQNIKKKQLDTKTSLYIHIIPSLRRIRIIPSLVDGLSCI